MQAHWIRKSYRGILHRMYSSLQAPFERSPTMGRLLCLPIGILLIVLFIPFKILFFLEDVTLIAINLLGCPFLETCTLQDAGKSLKGSLLQFIGLVISPFTALFVGSAVATAIFIDPPGTMKKMSDTTETYGS